MIEIKEKDDFINFNLIFEVDSEKEVVGIKIPKSGEEPNVNFILEDLSNTMLQMIERIKTLESQVSENLIFIEDSTIVRKNELDMILNWIDENKKDKIEFKLLYKASLHGDIAVDFHKLCDNKGPTISFIENSIGRRFGGYTALSWESGTTTNNSYKGSNDTTAFVFSLDRKRKFKCTDQNNVIRTDLTLGVCFGSGDIYIQDNFWNKKDYSSNSRFPNSYGKGENYEFKPNTYLSGAYNFRPKDVEVYSVIIK